VSKAKIKDLPASIHERLLQQARVSGRPLNELLQYYAIERFLYRLSCSRYAGQFVLKGALLFRVWGLPAFRPTRDIDLLGFTSNEVSNLVAIVQELCMLEVPDDGIRFDPESVKGKRIKEDADYEGVRLRFMGFLGRARLNLQMDVGFDDVVTPAPLVKAYPAILEMPVPELRSYPPETVVAEKLQAMIYLGSANSRMKDFYDLWIFACMIEFKGEVLQDAIRRTFEHRDTDVPENEPVAFSERFANDKQDLWLAFVKTSSIKDAPEQMETVIAHLRKFIFPVFESIRTDMKFTKTWSADGPWK
jgi:predicted nucleotidyltransferase component of viral defense system